MKRGNPMIQRRFVALLLLAGSLMFCGGAVATLFPVDAQGTSIFLLPPLQRLAAMAAYIPLVQWLSLLQLSGSIAAASGMTLLTRILWTTGRRALPLLGLVTCYWALVLWILIEAFDLGTSVWVAQEMGKTSTAPAFYPLVFFWMEVVMNNLSVALDFCALALYGGALLGTPILPRWGGWIMLLAAGAGLGRVILTGALYDPPEFVYLLLGLLGVLLLLRGDQLPTEGFSGKGQPLRFALLLSQNAKQLDQARRKRGRE